MPVNVRSLPETSLGPLPMSDDFAVALGVKESTFEHRRDQLRDATDEMRYSDLVDILLPRLRLEHEQQQEVIFTRFTALYLVDLLRKWEETSDPGSCYFIMLLQLQHNPYYHSFLSLSRPPRGYTSRWIIRAHADKMISPQGEWNDPKYFDDQIYNTCQFLATMLLWEDSEDALSTETVDVLKRRILHWQSFRPGVEQEEHPVPRALGLLNRDAQWVARARRVKQDMTKTRLGCNKRGCAVPFIPEQDTLKQCSKCKVARYCTAEHQRADWKEHKNFCHAAIWIA
ncbi:hypothetical protein PUNSTDRAFT_48990 [Punctularia strigosozonata HHB-11173 SS5]|uniref:uncharacterized protein n=1 Tax=Punctularia strigosozonata (strain HHB-11173) TaxID=741275 RepID=UPI0004418468|nr:uncharacterized protein PUNSTDRAFT_48990 [Punctularia strigosozonata HHB-11173 SS5]EIN14158.1 hypothetical protein PUNSTDRAFT_48990 [Punctularia strigosozonata HHB-11173 SS5]